MKNYKLIIAGVCLLALALPMATQAGKGKSKDGGGKGDGGEATTSPSDVYAKYDTNSDGTLDADETAAIKKAIKDDESLKQYDTDNNGKLSDDEISAIPATMSSEASGGEKEKKGGKKSK